MITYLLWINTCFISMVSVGCQGKGGMLYGQFGPSIQNYLLID